MKLLLQCPQVGNQRLYTIDRRASTRVPISSLHQHHGGRTRCRRSWLDIRQCTRARL